MMVGECPGEAVKEELEVEWPGAEEGVKIPGAGTTGWVDFKFGQSSNQRKACAQQRRR